LHDIAQQYRCCCASLDSECFGVALDASIEGKAMTRENDCGLASFETAIGYAKIPYHCPMKKLLGSDPAPEWVEFLNFHTQILHIKANDMILNEGDAVEGLYSIVQGKVKVMQKDGEDERLVKLAGPHDILGHRGFGGDWKYPISAVAVVATELEFLPLRAFHTIAKINADFVCNLMMFFAEELRISEEKKLQLTVLQRIAKTILMNYTIFGLEEGSNFLSYTISRKDMASHAGTTYESVIRTLADLAKRDIIQLEGKTIGILDLQALKTIAAEG
jgi:CRP-like cAMP-binding protein